MTKKKKEKPTKPVPKSAADEPNKEASPCPECNATGEIWDQDDNIDDCDMCGGTGIAP